MPIEDMLTPVLTFVNGWIAVFSTSVSASAMVTANADADGTLLGWIIFLSSRLDWMDG
jgi:hypothetical protein